MMENEEQKDPWGRPVGDPYVKWTDQQKRRLMVLVHDGFSDEKIASDLGRTVRSVAIKRCKMGLTIRTLSTGRGVKAISTDALARELRLRGYTVTKRAAERDVGGAS